MTIYRNFLAVSYGEFQCLYNFGEISVIRNRLTAIPFGDSGDPVDDPHHSATMLGRSPAYDPNDEEGILLLSISEVATASGRSGYLDPGLLSISFSSVERVVPLGERSFRILGGRLREMGVRLSQPFFEKSARTHRMEKLKQSSLKAGNGLVRLLIGSDCEHILEKQREALGLALHKVEYPDNEISDTLGDKATESVLPAIFSYTRHEPVHNFNTDCFEDLGICIGRHYGKSAPVVEDYRAAFRAVGVLARKPGCSLFDVLSDEPFYSALCTIAEKYAQYFPIHPLGVSVFLKWKDEFHRSNDSLNLLALREECQGVADSVGAQVVEHSLWLLGCYIGHDRMATLLYSTAEHALPVFEGTRSKLSPIFCGTRKNGEVEGATPEVSADTEIAESEDSASFDETRDEPAAQNDGANPAEQPMATGQSSEPPEDKDTTELTSQPGSVTDEDNQSPLEENQNCSKPVITADEVTGLTVAHGTTPDWVDGIPEVDDGEIAPACSANGGDKNTEGLAKNKKRAKSKAKRPARKRPETSIGDSPSNKPKTTAKRVAKKRSTKDSG